MSRLPRDEILARTDLPALADELLGPRRGRGASVTWPCPTHQPQTGRTPPVSVFTTARSEQRWHCHACGTGGTAIDLLIAKCGMNIRAALEALAARASLHPRVPILPRRELANQSAATRAEPILRAHVERCARLLDTERGRVVRDWLHARGFHDDTLRTYRVGADPGPQHLDRPRGLPRGGPAAIFPIIEHDEIVYFQARYLDPDRARGRKYDNPVAALATNPRLAALTPHGAAPETVFVCEGLPDALSVAQTGHRAVAVLGVGLASTQIAQRLHHQYPDVPIRVAFDNDAHGAMGRDAVVDELHALGHTDSAALTLPDGINDLNQWLQSDSAALAEALERAAPDKDLEPPGITLEL